MKRAWIPFALVAIAVLLALCALERPSQQTEPPTDAAPTPAPARAENDLRRTPRPRTRLEPPEPEAPAADTPVPSPPKATATIAGRVTDTQGAAFPGALVWLDGPTPTPGFTISDADGRYEFPAPPGRRALHARGSGTATARLELDVPDGILVHAPTLVLGCASKLTWPAGGPFLRPCVFWSCLPPKVRTSAKKRPWRAFLRRALSASMAASCALASASVG